MEAKKMSYDSNSLNLVVLTGRLGSDPELGVTKENKVPFAKLNLACKKAWKDKNQQRQEQVTWLPILFWRKQAELCGQLLKKGNLVSIVGSLAKETWEENETKRSRLYVLGQSFTPLGAKPKSEETAVKVEEDRQAPEVPEGAPEDDLPF